MSPTLALILFILGIVLLLVGLALSYQSSQAQKTFEEAKDKLDAERAELERRASNAEKKAADKPAASKKNKKNKKAAEPVQTTVVSSAQEDELKKQLKNSREKLNKQREKNQHVTRERDSLKKKVSDLESAAKQPSHNHNALVDMRMELAEAKQEAASFKQKLEELGSKRGSSRKEAPVVAVVEERKIEKVEEVVASREPVDAEDQSNHIAELKGRLKSMERDMRDQESGLKKKLRKQGRDIERQMRRADNNDKAYRITQRELDAARERVAMLTEQLERAQFASTSTSAAQEHPGLVEIAPIKVVERVAEEEMTMESPEITKELIEQDAALAEFSQEHDIISEIAGESERAQKDDPETIAMDASDLSEDPETVMMEIPKELLEKSEALVETEPEAPAEEPVVEPAQDNSAPEEPESKPEELAAEPAAADAETEIKRIAEVGGEGLAEVSAVDEAWGEFDLDDDDEDM